MTAGHNLYQEKYGGWAKSVQVIPACENEIRPFNIISASKIFTLKDWTTPLGHFPGSSSDLGIISLSEEIGNLAGYFGINTYRQSEKMLTTNIVISGYPGDKENGLVHYGQLDKITRVSNSRFEYLIDTKRGQSGSPAYTLDRNLELQTISPKLLGIHTTGFSSKNSSIRITDSILKSLTELS